MLPEYKRKANIGAAVWLASMVSIIPIALALPPGSNIWDDGNVLVIAAFLIMGVALFYALWAYLKAKGQSPLWILLLLVLNLIGLIVIALLPDKHKTAGAKTGDW